MKKFRLGIDIHNTLDRDPKFFIKLCEELRKKHGNNIEIHIISGSPWSKAIEKQLKNYHKINKLRLNLMMVMRIIIPMLLEFLKNITFLPLFSFLQIRLVQKGTYLNLRTAMTSKLSPKREMISILYIPTRFSMSVCRVFLPTILTLMSAI